MDCVLLLREAVLEGPGAVAPALRRAVAARTARLAGWPGLTPPGEAPAELPPELGTYVDLVARHADQVSDEDVAALGRAGWSEEEVFDLTIAAALGAGLGRLERGLAALRTEAP